MLEDKVKLIWLHLMVWPYFLLDILQNVYYNIIMKKIFEKIKYYIRKEDKLTLLEISFYTLSILTVVTIILILFKKLT